jgi:hypothetical protein
MIRRASDIAMRVRSTRVACAVLAVVVVCPALVTAQERRTGTVPVQEEATRPPVTISPGGALWRAFLVPGWGHAAIGSYTRGGFYFALQTATVYTLVRTRLRLNEAESRLRFREDVVRRKLMAEGIVDPAQLDELVTDDQGVEDLTSLIDSRKEQREDLIAAGLFFLLISGVDAYVSAHLAHFPEPLDLEAVPVGDGRFEMSLKLRLSNQ